MHNHVESIPRRAGRAVAYLLLSLALVACASARRPEARGTPAPVNASAAIANNTGSTTRDAILDAVVGGAIGDIIGRQMDQQAKEIIGAGATVERIGEGIRITFDAALLYAAASDQLRPEADQSLRRLATTLDRYRDTDLLIIGHTDSAGTVAANQDLSARRARSVSDYLVAQGANPSRLRAEGRGEEEPVSPIAGASGRHENRRVEVAIYASTSYRNELKREYGGRD